VAEVRVAGVVVAKTVVSEAVVVGHVRLTVAYFYIGLKTWRGCYFYISHKGASDAIAKQEPFMHH